MRLKWIPVACALLALALLAPAAGQAATFTVNTPADTSVPGGCETDPACSLRDAITAASNSADPEDVVAVPSGNYLVTEGELTPTGSDALAIVGAGARTTVIASDGGSRVFNVQGDQVRIEGVTITGGFAGEMAPEELAGDGGGILAYEVDDLLLNGVNVVGNTAHKNGGGISAPPEGVNAASITVTNSTVANNKVAGGLLEGLGGGIYVLGDLALTNTTVAGNSAESTVGMVQGGGVLAALDPTTTEPSKVNILNSTIAGNSVGATGIGGGLSIYNPTPGVVTELTVRNTIVAGNTGPAGPSDCGSVTVVTSTNNLSSDASCLFLDPGSKQNTPAQLGPLADNGGQTDTMALLEGSPAIDAGTNEGCPPADQRGVARPQGPACDIGAFEREVTPPPAAKSADLRLRVKAKPKKPRADRKFAFLVRVSNRGPDAATGAVVKGTVPALAKKAIGPKVDGKRRCKLGKVKGGKRKLTCRLGSIAAGKRKTVRVVVAPKHAGKLRTRARVRSALPDPNLKNNKGRAAAQVRD
jgi:CSLREA domain-containing protein